MRRIAGEVGCSTTVLYTMFGGKQGLAEGIYQEGFERFRLRLNRLRRGKDSLRDLYRLCHEYRRCALAEPDYYRVMFGQAIPGFVPSLESVAISRASFAVLPAAVESCIVDRTLAPGDVSEISEVIWAAAHGVISLELSGHISRGVAKQRFQTSIEAATTWFTRD